METMDQLTAEQTLTGDTLCTKLELIGKEPIARRTQKYVEKMEKEVNDLWERFEEQHQKIVKLNQTNHEYFTKKYYDQVRSVKQKALAKLSTYAAALTATTPQKVNNQETQHNALTVTIPQKVDTQETQQNGNAETSSKYMIHNEKELRWRRERIRIESLQKHIERVNSNIELSTAAIELHSKHLTEDWKHLENLHEEVLIFSENENEVSELSEQFEAVREEYIKTLTSLQEKLSISNVVRPTENDIRLPRLNIPIFEGKYETWTTFHDIFFRLIHNNNRLANVEKMQYSKTNLRGEAARLLNHLEISDSNYSIAWEIITDRYENKRKLLSVHLQALLSLPKLETESIIGLKRIHDTMKECLHGITNLGIDTTSWAPIVIHLVIQKFDYETLKLFEQSHTNAKEVPDFEAFYKFLTNRFQSLEAVGETKSRGHSLQTQYVRRTEKLKPQNIKNYVTTTEAQCRCCQKNHSIYICPEFLSLSTEQRNEMVKRNNLCRNCINHTTNEKCRSNRTCNICQKQHHTLLHRSSNQPTNQDKAKKIHVQNTLETQEGEVLLATALIRATAINGKQELLRVLIDTGSQASCITEQAVQILSLPKAKTCVKLSGLGATEASTAIGKVDVQIQPRFPSDFQMNIEAFVLPKLTKKLPNNDSNISIPWKNCLLADPTFNKSGPIDMIIGADAYTTIVQTGIKKANKNILAQKTEFGWVISGKIPNTHNQIKIVAMISQTKLNEQLRQFWEMEETPSDQDFKSSDDICEKHFQETHVRSPDGTYTVQIPFKAPMKQLGDSRRQALARLLQNEKKFRTDKQLEQEYKKFMAEYIYLNHMKLINQPSGTSEDVYYLPHQAVLKADSTTTKLRVVFDASAKTSTGISLNDNMLAGPRLQPELAQILLRWRKHQFVFTADVEKMYRQIKLAEKDQNYHRILWRFNPNEPVEEYQLTTVTYGTTSAPFLAIRTIQQLAKDEREKYPKASKVVFQDFYVDDLMSGANTLQNAKQLQIELIKLLSAGGFKLRKWTSNHPQLLKNIPEEIREKGILTINKDKTIKTLGVHWNPTSDTFHFKVNADRQEKVTKRTMLSKIAQIFDPLGWLTPVTLRAKIMLQELWKAGIPWDETPPTKLMMDWKNYQQKLHKLEEIKIQRWMNYDTNLKQVELHGFCDASERAYAAVIYSKIITASGTATVQLITARSKVAPVKSKMTIPRLELCAAELLSKLMAQTVKTLELDNIAIYLWSDSMVTITRVKGTLAKQQGFEANRITKILSLTNPQSWNYVRTGENPADCASRGMNPDQIKEYNLWWNGPQWLKSHKDQWPITPIQISNDGSNSPKQYTVLLARNSMADPSLFDRFSTFKRCARVIAYCRRFINKSRTNHPRIYGNLTVEETERAQKSIIKCIQTSFFSEEMEMLLKGKPVPNKSKLISLNPFLDEDGLIRIGGRLELSTLSYDERHPIIIPQKSHITKLLIKDAHSKTLHGGIQQTLAYLRRKYWIINARNRIKQHIYECNICFRIKARTCQQIMGNLPPPRVTPSPPFTHTGVDYAGPIQLKASKVAKTKAYKGYIALFVCLSTKAIHLEVVSDLTSEAFIAAFNRFTARRGHCQHLYSHCGTNFIGAQKMLDKDFPLAIRNVTKEVAEMITSDSTQWHFNPPAAPHMGGIWEAGIKSTKYHLKRIVGSAILTYEELITTLNQIEASLNSRPLCPLTDDPSDCNALTPGHFLIGRAPLSPPRTRYDEKTYSYLTRWKLVNKLSDDFWRIWSSEYLSRLQQRPKWWKEKENLKINELVLIKDENLPPTKWRLARIIETHPGTDGKIRVVTLRCGNNTIVKRPVTKLCRLPTTETMDNETIKENHVNNAQDNQILMTHKISSPLTKEPKKRKLMVPPVTSEEVKRRYFKELEKAKRAKKCRNPKGTYIRPVTGYSNLVPLEQQRLAKERYDAMKELYTGKARTKKAPNQSAWNTALTCLSLLSAATVAKAGYTINHPQPGLYVEHIGEASIRRGTLRVELTLPLNTTADTIRINKVIDQMRNVCISAKKTSEDIQCEPLLHHLVTQGKYLLEEINIVTGMHSRNKRGLLGKALQYVFGVNDEVYTDISALRQNQQLLHQASLHQSSIMLTTIAHINDTEVRITEKINSFTNKLNAAMKEINVIQGWFTTINVNMINLHVLTAYQIATNMLDELERQYSRIVTTLLGQGSLLNFISASRVNEIINDAASNLPSSLHITNNPEERLDTDRNASSITLFGYFNIMEVDEYNIIKATPIPRKLENNTYLTTDIQNNILCVNYNKQTYFELLERDLEKCVDGKRHQVLCLPTAISSIEANSNCVINEIYDRPGKSPCPVKILEVPTILWKHLYMPNTWLFIATEPTAASIKCNGIHKDIELNNTGIIQITNECIIKTKQNTLIPEIFDRTFAEASFNKPMELNLTMNTTNNIQKLQWLQSEHVLKSTDQLLGVVKEQELLHQRIKETPLQTIGRHSLSATIAVIISISIIVCIKISKRRSWTKPPVEATQKPDFVLKVPTTPCSSTKRDNPTVEAENV